MSVESSPQRGSVVRITLRNFLTYDDLTVHPGPRLNLIIGPNGTGKSTLVCALVLGLAGSPAVLGRAQHVSQFIKDGTEVATIEIELYDLEGNQVICRLIDKQNRSTWKHQGEPATLKHIQGVIKKFNIQVDNLCQVLPQERVQDFVKLDSKGLLEGTEKAVGYPGMDEDHEFLKNQNKIESKLIQDLDVQREMIQKNEQKMNSLQQVVDNRLKRKKFESQVTQLKQRREWLRCEHAGQQLEQVKRMKEEAEKKLKSREKELEPIKALIEKGKKDVQAFKLKLETNSKSLNEKSGQSARLRQQVENIEGDVQQLQLQHVQRVNQERERGLRADKLRQKLEYDRQQLAQVAEVGPSLEAELRAVEARLRQLADRVARSQDQEDQLVTEREQAQGRLNAAQAELQRVRDVDNRRLELLRQKNKDVYNAVLWLRKNHTMFKYTVHEPMVLVVNIQDTRMAKYVQASIPASDLYAFTCEDRADMNTFLKEIRDNQKLRVSCVLSDRQISMDSLQPKFSSQQLRSVGFQHTVADLFKAPEAVTKYLYRSRQVQNVPVADVDAATTRKIMKAMEDKRVQPSWYMLGNSSFRVRRSKYTGNESLSSQELRPVEPILAVVTEKGRETQLLAQVSEATGRLETVCTRIQQLQETAQTGRVALEEQRKQKKDLTARRDQRKSLELRVRANERSLRECEGQAVDIAASEQQTLAKKAAKLVKMGTLLEQLQAADGECQQLTLVREVTRLASDLAQRRQGALANELEEADAALQEERRSVQLVEREWREKRDEAARLREGALRMIGLRDGPELVDKLRQRFRCLPSTLEALEAAILDNETRAGMLQADDDTSQRDYDRVMEDKSRLEEKVAELEQQMETLKERIVAVREKWLPHLERLVSQINKAFSGFFREMGCAGEVVLVRGGAVGGQEVFSEYGISIRVQYRTTERLCELSGTHHSGGERSVATILYIMALQELEATVPFRCVDEINQGMDALNERRVFDLVVRTACRENMAQYFLITPKLLPGLTYPAAMTILCVYNSASMLSHRDWDVTRFCRIRRKRAKC